MGKEQTFPNDKATEKNVGSGVWEIKDKPEEDNEQGERISRRKSYSSKPERDSQSRPRRDFREDKPRRDFREDKPRRDFREDKPRRDFREDKPRRDFREDKPRRDFREDKPRRDFREDKPRKDFREDKKPRRDFREDKPRKDFREDKPRKDFREDKKPRRDFREDKPRRDFREDKPRRDFREDKPRRDFREDRPRRDFREDKPRKDFREDKPRKDSWTKERKYSSDDASHPRRRVVTESSRRAKRDDELVRLNKFIANSGKCSRREADEYIVAGLISVNGRTVTELGTKVRKDDEIRFNDERLKGEKKAYVLLNKPKNYITTTDDPHAKRTVMELIEGACKERVYPVGRLDRNSTGVLLFTNDGELAKQLTHPSYNKLKVYQVRLDKNITKADLTTLVKGVELEDGTAVADSVHVSETDKAELGVEIHSGRNRIIRRMFEKLGYGVVKLDRVYFAGLTKKGLQRGEYRLLTSKEIEMLKMGAYE